MRHCVALAGLLVSAGCLAEESADNPRASGAQPFATKDEPGWYLPRYPDHLIRPHALALDPSLEREPTRDISLRASVPRHTDRSDVAWARFDFRETVGPRDFTDGTEGSGAAGKRWCCKGKARSVGKEEPPAECPKFVTGCGKDRCEAQKAAKNSAPEQCRKFYGHFECWQENR